MTCGLEDPQGLVGEDYKGKFYQSCQISANKKDCLVSSAVKESSDIGSVYPKSKSSSGGGRMNERARRVKPASAGTIHNTSTKNITNANTRPTHYH